MPFRDLVFEEAQTIIREFLREIDTRYPGTICDVYLVGSLALREPRPGRSDIDLVLVRPEGTENAATMAALEPVLADLRQRYPEPELDAIVLAPSDLVTGPEGVEGIRPVIEQGMPALRPDGSLRNPVTWAMLRQSGIAWRGMPPAEIDLWFDPEVLRAWTRRNLEEYWVPWLSRRQRLLSRAGVEMLHADSVEWGVLGVTRLHATIATGDILSKYGAGKYALRTFSEQWHRIIREAMRIRALDIGQPQPSLYGHNRFRRRRDALSFIQMVIRDALDLP